MMPFVLAIALFAQILTQGQAYTTADPVNPERLGLATVDGRYMVQISDTGDCSWVTNSMNVTVWQVASDDGTRMDTAVKPVDDTDADYCYLIVYRKMDDTPCFETDGVCDVTNDPQS